MKATRPWLTVERALWAVLALLSLLVHLWNLGARPMQPDEARQALAAWQASQGLTVSWDGVTSALWFSLSTVFFAFSGGRDFTARLAPALFGVLLTLLPYGLRNRLGRTEALVAGALFAISPTILFFGRYLAPDIGVMTAALGLLVAFIHWRETGRRAWLLGAAVALALLLLAGPSSWAFLLLLLLWVMVRTLMAWRGRFRLRGFEFLTSSGPGLDPFLAFGLTFFLTATVFLIQWGGLGAAADLLPRWVEHFHSGGEYPWFHPLLQLALYEPFVLLFGLLGVVTVVRRPDADKLFLVWWAGAGLLLSMVAGGRTSADLVLALVPLILLAAGFVGRFLADLQSAFEWRNEGAFLGLALILLGYLFINLAGYSRTGDSGYYPLIAVASVFLLALVAVYWAWRGREQAWRGALLSLIVVLTALTVDLSWLLNFPSHTDRPELILRTRTSPQVLDFVEHLGRLSAHRLGDDRVLPVTVDEQVGVVVRWYLRDFLKARFVPEVTSPPGTLAVVTPGGVNPPLGEAYTGTDYLLQERWTPAGLAGRHLLRWILYREANTQPEKDTVILWVQRLAETEGE